MAQAKNVENKTQETVTDPMKVFVTVMLPRPTGKEENYQLVSLNGVNYQIKKGVPVQVPRPVAEIVWNSEAARRKQDAFIEQITEEAQNKAVNLGLF